jgi:predicted MFS family arabinose efflux permease
MRRDSGWHSALVRGRIAVTLLFLLYGVILGTWTARIPAVKHRLGLSDSQLSVGLLAFAAGAILGMQVSGRIVDRFDSRTVMFPAVLLDALLLVLPGFAGNLAVLACCLVAFGLVHGTLNVAMNVNAVEVQRAYRRPIISSCHAVYSVGGLLGAATGGLFARAGLGAAVTFAAVAGAVLLVVAVDRLLVLPAAATWAALAPDDVAPDNAPGPDDAAPDDAAGPVVSAPARRVGLLAPGVLLLGTLVFCCLVGEGAAADWSTVYLRDNLGAREDLATVGYAAFSAMMVAGRLVGDRLSARFGPVLLVRACGVLAAVGLAAGLLVGVPVAGIIGFGCLGAGLSCIAPQVFSAAGSRDPAVAGQAIARVAGLGFLGFVVGPVVIGFTARLVGLPHALLIPAVLALFVAGSASAIGTEGRRPSTMPVREALGATPNAPR